MLLHTDRVDQNGTDLPALIRALCPNYNVGFSDGKLPANQLNFLYNVASMTCQPSSAEGFGLSVMESIMSGTPILGTVRSGNLPNLIISTPKTYTSLITFSSLN